jgi:hypothetical protein
MRVAATVVAASNLVMDGLKHVAATQQQIAALQEEIRRVARTYGGVEWGALGLAAAVGVSLLTALCGSLMVHMAYGHGPGGRPIAFLTGPEWAQHLSQTYNGPVGWISTCALGALGAAPLVYISIRQKTLRAMARQLPSREVAELCVSLQGGGRRVGRLVGPLLRDVCNRAELTPAAAPVDTSNYNKCAASAELLREDST